VPATLLTVTGSESIAPHLRRVHFSADLNAFGDATFTDRYIKLVFGRPGVTYPEPFDMQAVRRDMLPVEQPLLRTYTVRLLDVAAGTLSVDFVVHGDEGLAGPWALRVQPGDRIYALGPGGKYVPSPDADWHLLVGDLAALPAIASSVAALPPGAVARVIVEAPDAGDVVDLGAGPGVEVRWVFAADAPPATPADAPLALAVRELEWLPGRVHVFAHGEAGAVMRGVRPYIVRERRVPTADVSISGYWRRGAAEEDFQASKRGDA
jgi:NADPH-dependent ferric siderophore reductase